MIISLMLSESLELSETKTSDFSGHNVTDAVAGRSMNH